MFNVTPNDPAASLAPSAVVAPHARARVIVVGSANEDIIVTMPHLPGPGDTVVGTSLTVLPGGKSANQAVAAARTGARVCFVGAVGDDEAGKRSAASLRDEGVNLDGLSTIERCVTGTALVLVSDDGENQIAIVAGANGVLDEARVASALEKLDVRAADVFLVGFEVGDGAVCAAARHAAANGCLLIVNPAPARPLPADVVAARPLLVPNRSEIALLTSAADHVEGARQLARQTGSAVVATLGVDGALIVNGGEDCPVPSLTVEAVDTTGAGDTLAGVLAAGLAQGLSLDAAVRRAVAAAALSVTVRGARPGSPTSAAIDAALAETAPRDVADEPVG